jgi:hypothetical protein
MGYGSPWRLRHVPPVATAAATVRRARPRSRGESSVGPDRRATAFIRRFFVGPAVVGALAGVPIGARYGWPAGVVGAYAVLALTQLLTFSWLLVWTRPPSSPRGSRRAPR